MQTTDDLRIAATRELVAPQHIIEQFELSASSVKTTSSARREIEAVLDGQDDRLVAIVGPCSIHDTDAALDYARRLKKLADTLEDRLVLVMRVYFEKPRTTVGWKGLINDPDLNNQYNVNKGLSTARQLLITISDIGVPAGCEYLDLITPQYIGDVVAWGAIGARTTESQCHRELASGLSCPVGFKNGTNGNLKIAVDAIRSAMQPHHFLSVTKEGRTAIVKSTGNEYGHIILRGGTEQPNFQSTYVESTSQMLNQAGLPANIMIDFSHANSHKNPKNQSLVCEDVCRQIAGGDQRLVGIMMESNIVEGNQAVEQDRVLTYGQSITDACIGWDETEQLCHYLADAVVKRRSNVQAKVSSC